MFYPIDNFKEDAYIITTDKAQYFIPAPMFEALFRLGKENDLDSREFDIINNGLYFGTDAITNTSHIAIGYRWWYSEAFLDQWKSIILDQKDNINFTSLKVAKMKSDFQSFSAKGMSVNSKFSINDLTEHDSINLEDLSILYNDILIMTDYMSSSDDYALKTNDIVIIDNAIIGNQNQIHFSKGRRRKCFSEKQLVMTEQQLEMFLKIISQGECKIDQIRFLIKSKNGKKSKPQIKENHLDDMEIVEYSGGKSFIFPVL